jgi:hypothetical protein
MHTSYVIRNESPWYWGKQFWTSIWCNCVVQYSSPIGAWYIHLLRRSPYMSHSPTTSAEWNTAPIKKKVPLETQMGYTCNMTECLPISDVQWKCIFFTAYLVNGLVIVVHRLTTYISSDLNPMKFYLHNHMKDVVFQQNMKTHDGVLCHKLDGANHVKDYFNKLMQATCSMHKYI